MSPSEDHLERAEQRVLTIIDSLSVEGVLQGTGPWIFVSTISREYRTRHRMPSVHVPEALARLLAKGLVRRANGPLKLYAAK